MSVFVDYYSAQNEVKLTAKKLKKYFMVTSWSQNKPTDNSDNTK